MGAESANSPNGPSGRRIGRYVLFDEIAAGGMATVHLGRLLGPVGFSRTVAIKRLHAQFAKDPEFSAMFIDEARLAARVRHPNVVPTLDVVSLDAELFLVMEYVQGESLSRLARALRQRREPMSHRILVGIMTGVLQGLHAAHEAQNERGEPLHIIHRDVSPQNVLVGGDGVARVLDFGVAKAAGRLATTHDGRVKGKAGYMAPEQLRGSEVDPRADVYAAAVVLWELLAGKRLFEADSQLAIMGKVLEGRIEPPSRFAHGVPPALDAIAMRGLSQDAAARFPTALDMADALEKAVPPATAREISTWVHEIASDALELRARRISDIESASTRFDDIGEAPTQAASPPVRDLAPADRSGASPVSEVTAMPLVASTTPPRRTRPSWMYGAALGVAVAAAIAGALLVRARLSAAPPSVPASVAVSAPPTATAVAAPEPTTAPVVPASAPPPEPPPTAARASASAAPTKAAPARPVIAPPAKPAPAKPSTQKPNCNPPYTLDPTGIHIAKPECY